MAQLGLPSTTHKDPSRNMHPYLHNIYQGTDGHPLGNLQINKTLVEGHSVAALRQTDAQAEITYFYRTDFKYK